MKLLVISQHYAPEIGAAANRVYNIVDCLSSNFEKITVLTSVPLYPKKHIYNTINLNQFGSNDRIEIVRLHVPFKEYSRNPFVRTMLYIYFFIKVVTWSILNSYKFDYIIASSPPIFVGLAGVVASYLNSAKLILDVRDLWPNSVEDIKVVNRVFLEFAYIMEKFLYKRSYKIIITSMAFKKILNEKGVNSEKIVYLPNGIRKDLIQAKEEIKKEQDNEVRVIYSGNIGLAQGLETLIEAAKILEMYRNIKFIIIGDGVEANNIRNKIGKLNLKNIQFIGPLNKASMYKELAKSDIAVLHLRDLPIFETVIPSKIFDYMLCKLPIVAGVKGQAKRILDESGCALVCGPENSKGMAELILELANNPELRLAKGNRGFNFLKQNFIWEENIKVLEQLIKQCKEIRNGHY